MKKLPLALMITLFANHVFAADQGDPVRPVPNYGLQTEQSLPGSFKNPPNESRPRTWWHWLNSHVSKEGITKDLEAMKRIGLKGAQITTMPYGGPYGQVKYLSPAWFEAVEHTEKEAKRLGLIVGFSNAISCSGAGGPWITPELSMQKLVWSEVQKQGPFEGEVTLPEPEKHENYYRDIRVFAFPTLPCDDRPLSSLLPKITSNIPNFNPATISDGSNETSQAIVGEAEKYFVQYEFNEPYTVRSLQVFFMNENKSEEGGVPASLSTSEDGVAWINKIALDGSHRAVIHLSEIQLVSSGFAELKSRFYKVELPIGTNRKISINEINFGGARLPLFVNKTARSSNWPTQFEPTTINVPQGQIIQSRAILDLTQQMEASGKLHCKLPEGNWTVIRFGHTSTGQKMGVDYPPDRVHPGLEADKMSKKAILTHITQGLVGQVLEQHKKWADKVKITVNIDSWECGSQTWTPNFDKELQQRRGYDGLSRLLTATGRIVDSVDETERYLWDYRRTIADLYAENFYGTFKEFCNANDLLLDGEAPGIGIPAIADGLQCLGMMDVPQGEFWIEAKPGPDRTWGVGGGDNTKEAAVAAHVYGKTLASCEAFTAFGYADGWQMDPRQLKPIGDRQFCLGLNEMVFHRYAHQPDDRVPGMTLGQFGLNFDRSLTWWEQGRDWIQYLTRCQHILRQGLFVADVCYFYGENAPSSVYYYAPKALDPRKMNKPILPAGYDYDCCDWTTLNKMTVEKGRVVLPDGLSYAYLVMPANAQLTVHALKKVSALVKAGATVVGPRPFRSPSLTNYPEADQQIQAIAKEIWPEAPAPSVKKSGLGRVIQNTSFEEILSNDKLAPDFEAVAGRSDADIRAIHRKLGNTDIYYVCNQQDRSEETQLLFRVSGKIPELWNPETGSISTMPIYKIEKDRTMVAIRLQPHEAFFVVFSKASNSSESIVKLIRNGQSVSSCLEKPPVEASYLSSSNLNILPSLSCEDDKIKLTTWEAGDYSLEYNSGAQRKVSVPSVPAAVAIEGPWNVTFQANRLAPEGPVRLDKLISWPQHETKGIKYFSGMATYSKTIPIPKRYFGAKQKVHLDLGGVKNVAEVFVNGKALGVLWKPPFRVDITSAANEGDNKIEIQVTNLWPNRLIGDETLPEKERVTWCFHKFYTKDSPLLESGLLGPVQILSSGEVEIGRKNL